MLGSECDFKMYVRNLGCPSLYKSGSQKPHFRRLRNSTATLTACTFGTKHNIDNRTNALKTAAGVLHCLKVSWTLVHKRLKIGPDF